MSTLSAFPFIGEQSFATPGAFNSPLSIISANIAAINTDVGAISGVTITPPSGNTITIASNLSVRGQLQAGPIYATGPVRVDVPSGQTNYLYLSDLSNLRSNYILGSQVGGTADGLNLWDDSGQTMLVSFSKQSIRFYQNVVGPVFDVGGALADTLNAATFGTGTDSRESRIQAAISAASGAGISRVYVPANMYPYSAASVSFDTRVQMVREGGDYSVHDVRAYGGAGNNIADDTSALSGALGGVGGGKIFDVYVPPGIYRLSSKLSPYSGTVLRGIAGASMISLANGASSLFVQAISRTSLVVDGLTWDGGSQPGWNTTSLQFDNCSDVVVRHCAFRNTKMPIWIRGTAGACQRVLIDNNNFGTVTDFAVRADEATYGTDIGITRNYVTNVVTGVAISPTAFALIANRSNVVGNIVVATEDSGVIASGNVADVLVANNMITSTKVSIFVGTGVRRAIVANNVLSSATDFGIDFQGAGAISDELVASGNVIRDCGKSGINLEDVNRATVIGNTIARVGQATGQPDQQRCGISFVQVSNASVKWTSILGNIIYDDAAVPTMRYGILVQPTNDFTHIWGNSVQNAIVLNYNYVVPTTSYFLQTDQALRVLDGTALVPVYSFGSEASLGFYHSVASTIALSYGTFSGSVLSAATVRATQVGIGAFQAGNMVTISTDAIAASTIGLRIRGTLTSRTTDLFQVTDSGSADAVAFSVSSRGTTYATRLGINTTTPALLFDVSNTTDAEINIKSNSTNSLSAVRLGNFNRRWDIRNDATQTNQPFVIRDATAAADRLLIDSNGQVNIVSAGLATLPALSFSDVSLGWYRSGVSTMALSYGTLNLATQAVRLSMRTIAASALTASAANTNVAVNETVFTVSASGASWAINSGGTTWIFNSDASAKNT